MRFQRINAVGSPGSGKTTFGLPFYEIDQLFWKPDWRESSDEELFAKVEKVTGLLEAA